MDERYLAMLNTVYEDGSIAEIIAASIVENPEEGEFWFCNNKPIDGTQVDYTLHKLTDVLKQKTKARCHDELVKACKMGLKLAEMLNHPDEYHIKAALENVRKKCSRCPNTENIQAHHPDYYKPLEIIWLCYDCHCIEEAKIRETNKGKSLAEIGQAEKQIAKIAN